MAFYSNQDAEDIEAKANREEIRVVRDLDFAYNVNPRILPFFRSAEMHPQTEKPQENIRRPTRSLRYYLARMLQQCWLVVFFRLPALYQSRVLQIGFGVSTVDLHLMSTTFLAHWKQGFLAFPNSGVVSPELMQFKTEWEVFIDDLLQEWRVFNVISVLLEIAALVLLAVDIQSGSDPVTRTGILLSLICAGISLLCGSFCLLRFGSMRKMPKAAKWIQEAQLSNQLIWWNDWIVLSMPATWLAWAVCLFFATIMSYTWHSSFQSAPVASQISAHTVQSLRIAVTAVLAFGILCFGALSFTLSSKFGDALDQEFASQIQQNSLGGRESHPNNYEQPKMNPLIPFPTFPSQSQVQLSPDIHRAAFPTTKLIDVSSSNIPVSAQLPHSVQHQRQNFYPWDAFISNLRNSFSAPTSEDAVFECIKRWNDQIFKPSEIEAILCLEFPLEADTEEGNYAVYVMDLAQARADGRQKLVDIFGPLPSQLRKICLIDVMAPSVSRRRGYPLGLTLEREAVETPGPGSVEDPSKNLKEQEVPPTPVESEPKIAESSPVSSQPLAGPTYINRPSQPTTIPTDRRITTVTTRPNPRQGIRANSAPQAVANSRSRRISNSNTTATDNRARPRTRTDSSQRVSRRR